jgi:hypothetical protein
MRTHIGVCRSGRLLGSLVKNVLANLGRSTIGVFKCFLPRYCGLRRGVRPGRDGERTSYESYKLTKDRFGGFAEPSHSLVMMPLSPIPSVCDLIQVLLLGLEPSNLAWSRSMARGGGILRYVT